MENNIFEVLMRVVLEEVKEAIQERNSPFAALLVDNGGNIISIKHNKTKTELNPTAHAEMLLIQDACKKLNTKDLSPYYLVCNAESCPMCMSAIVQSGIKKVVYGADMEPHTSPYIRASEIVAKSNFPEDKKVKLVPGVLKEECTKQIADARRAKAESKKVESKMDYSH